MAKSVSLTGDVKPTEAELLARVTGQKKNVSFLPPPKPAAPPPVPVVAPPPVPVVAPPTAVPPALAASQNALKGKPPIPRNAPVFTPDPNTLTEAERLALAEINWKPGEQLTGNIPELLEQARAEAAAEKAAALDQLSAATPTTISFQPQDVNTLPPEKQAEIRRRMAETVEANRMEAERKEQLQTMSQLAPGVREAMKVATAPGGLEVEDDRPKRKAQAAQQPPTPPPAAEPERPADTGVTSPHPGNCPHCGWDQTEPDDVKVEAGDKTAFLHSMLGEKTFSKNYALFGGAVTVTFRSLTGQEIDKIYAQCFREKNRGEIMTDFDFYERVNRYRLYLQLQSMRSNAFHHDFPDGFTAETNNTASSFYELPPDLPEGETGLRLVESHVVKTALKTEILIRTVTNECRLFNRLVSKLEAMADNPDFWPATGG